jgi:ribonuclease HI
MAAVGLAPDVVLVTYETRSDAGHARRSSVWLKARGRWQLRHHQGTRVPTGDLPASGHEDSPASRTEGIGSGGA